MNRELWLMDPGPFLDIAMQQGFNRFTVRGFFNEASSIRTDWTRFFRIAARGRPWTAMWLDRDLRYAVEFDSEHGFEDPVGCYPIWSFNRGDTDATMQEWIENPWGDNPDIDRGSYGIGSRKILDVAGIKGQKHRILVTGVPKGEDAASRLLDWIADVQDDGVELFLHSCQSLDRLFGQGVRVFDHPVRARSKEGPNVLLPNATVWDCATPASAAVKQWLSVIGYRPAQFVGLDKKKLSRVVYDANLRTLRWCLLNWDQSWDFRKKAHVDIEASDSEWAPPLSAKLIRRPRNVNLLDQYLCDTCTLRETCPAARPGAICIMPDSPASELAEAFGSRSSKKVITGLGKLMQLQAERLERALESEESEVARAESELRAPKFSPEVTKMMAAMFNQGVQLAKLMDPKLSGSGPLVQIGINGQPSPALDSPAVMVGTVVRELEKRGVAPEDATVEMVREIAGGSAVDEVVEAHVISDTEDDF